MKTRGLDTGIPVRSMRFSGCISKKFT